MLSARDLAEERRAPQRGTDSDLVGSFADERASALGDATAGMEALLETVLEAARRLIGAMGKGIIDEIRRCEVRLALLAH